MNPLILALLQQVILPNILIAIRAHYNATGKMPTNDEILSALGSETTKGINIGEAWLAAHNIDPVPQVPPTITSNVKVPITPPNA